MEYEFVSWVRRSVIEIYTNYMYTKNILELSKRYTPAWVAACELLEHWLKIRMYAV